MNSLYDAAVRGELMERLQTVTPESPRQWGKMSAHGMICHLGDTMRTTLGERSVSPNGNWAAHNLIKPLCLWTPFPWPKGVKTSPELDAQQKGTPATEFGADLDTLMRLIERCAEHDAEQWPSHPFFGPLSRTEWGRFHYLHLRHHLRQFSAWQEASPSRATV